MESFMEPGEELAAKQAAQYTNRQEEARPTCAPLPVFGQASRGHDAVHVRMMDECLTPGVEDGEESEFGTQMFRIQGDLLQRTGRGTQQQIIEKGRILKSERSE